MPLPLLDFDPYEVWLGIKSHERPPNPYELLNLVPFDADRSRVRAALDRRLTTLEGKLSGADPEIGQTLRDELEAAAAALLDSEQRAVIDGAIKRRSATGGAARPDGVPPIAVDDPTMLTCSSCQCENPSSRRFCGGCGQGLWETCPQCGGGLPAQERYCGQCGTDVRHAVLAQSREIQERLQAADRFATEHRYDAALSALRAVAALDDPKLQQCITHALVRIREVEAQRQHVLAEATAAKVQAAQFVKQSAFDWAVRVLENIPLPLRDEEARTILAQARFSSQEIEALLAEITQAVEQKRYGGLFAKIQRFLSLKPEQPPVMELAAKLRKQFIAGARKRLVEQRYDDALRVLEQIPPEFHCEEARALLAQASELSALLADLKESPYATPQALALAQRLMKQAPDNAQASSLVQQLDQKCAADPADRRLAMTPWAASRKRSDRRPPVQWLGHFLNAAPSSDGVAQTLRKHPGEFFIALGLALQGLDEAAIATSLMPSDKGSMLSKLASLPILARSVSSAWGIDLGEYSLKALKLVKDSSGKVKVEACHYIQIDRRPAPHAPVGELARLQVALSDLVTRADFKAAKVVVSLPGQRVLGRFFQLPPLPVKKVKSAVEYEARHQIPIDLAELCWDWKALAPGMDKPGDQGSRSIMLLAARRSHVEERLSLLKAAGIGADGMQSECLALHNALQFELSHEAEASSPTIAVMEIGGGQSNVVVSSRQAVWFRSFGLGGESFTTALMQRFQLRLEQAEQLKRHPEKAHRYCEFREAIETPLAQLTGEIDRSLAGYRQLTGCSYVHRLYVLGGGARLHGLLRKLLD